MKTVLLIVICLFFSFYMRAQDSSALTISNSYQYAELQARQLKAELTLNEVQFDSVKLIYADYYNKLAASVNLTLSGIVRRNYLFYHEHVKETRLMKNLTPTQWELKRARDARSKQLADSLQQAAAINSFKKQ